jgi:hypothetical protein
MEGVTAVLDLYDGRGNRYKTIDKTVMIINPRHKIIFLMLTPNKFD